ncbi:MAG: hypothetical protein NUV51_03530 [Sulfuricaulis sp.]|nr:hypothetical protein [Sulfuricaulis sp.]
MNKGLREQLLEVARQCEAPGDWLVDKPRLRDLLREAAAALGAKGEPVSFLDADPDTVERAIERAKGPVEPAEDVEATPETGTALIALYESAMKGAKGDTGLRESIKAHVSSVEEMIDVLRARLAAAERELEITERVSEVHRKNAEHNILRAEAAEQERGTSLGSHIDGKWRPTPLGAEISRLEQRNAALAEAVSIVWPFFEGEHFYDHPDSVKVRALTGEKP